MKKITKPTNVYKISELKGAPLQKALRYIQKIELLEDIEDNKEQFMESAEKFAQKFGFRVIDCNTNCFDHDNLLTVDIEQYFKLTNEVKNDLVKLMNDTYKEEAGMEYSLTGAYTDYYFFDYFKEKKGTSYNTFHKDVPAAMQAALKAFVSDQEQDLTDDEYAQQYANDMEILFHEDGSLFIY